MNANRFYCQSKNSTILKDYAHDGYTDMLNGEYVLPEYVNDPFFYENKPSGYLQNQGSLFNPNTTGDHQRQYNSNLLRQQIIDNGLHKPKWNKTGVLDNYKEHMTAEDQFRLEMANMHNKKSEYDDRYDRMNSCATAQYKRRCCNKLNPQYDLSCWGKQEMSDNIGYKEGHPHYDYLEFNLMNRLNTAWQKQPLANTNCSYNNLMYNSRFPNFMSDKLFEYC